MHSWWIPAPLPQKKFLPLPNEPAKVLKSPKVVLHLSGAAGNKSYYNNVARDAALWQLGFSVLAFDYRGFGRSQGMFPTESQMYADSEIALNYLIEKRKILLQDIVIYDKSLGGAIAINLAVKHPEIRGLIVQSSFTTMAKVIQHTGKFWLFPVEAILTQKFDSISKVRSLQVPVLFIHGTADVVVPYYMSQQLYKAAPQPKQLLLVPEARHFRIYRQGKSSYLQAI